MRDNDRTRDKLSRRRYAQLLAAGGIAGLAGCGGGDGTATPDGSGDGGDTPMDTATPTESDGDGGMTPTATDEGTPTESEQTRPPDSERMTDTVRVFQTNTADEFNFNPFTPSDNTAGDLLLTQLDGLYNVTNAANWAGSPTLSAPHVIGHDEIEIVTWVEDYEVEAPYDMYNYHDDRCTFWNGEPYDAEARYLYDRVRYFSEGNKFAEGAVHRQEALSQWDYHWYRSKGEVPGAEADPANSQVLDMDTRRTDGNFPLPPVWSNPWIDRFEAASTEESYQTQISNLRGVRISFEDLAENGWGSGPYEIVSPDDVGSESVRCTLRSEDLDATAPHPTAEHANVDFMELQLGSIERERTIAGEGQIDVHEGAVTPNGPDWNPERLPDHNKELTRYLKSNGGDALWWNMNNPHLENLWFRRAFAHAVDFEQAGNNGWGPQRSIPLSQDTGCLDAAANATFSQEFMDQLHTYPKTGDTETATEFMQNGGYERQGGTWVGPAGNEPQVDIQIRGDIGDWVGAAQTIRDQMQSFGVPMTFSAPDNATWTNNLDTFQNEPNYDISIHWYNQASALGNYKSQAAWWDNGSIVGGDRNVAPGGGGDRRSADPDDEYTIVNQPLQVELPTEVGSIEAPTGADAAPNNPADLSGNGIDAEEVNVIETMEALRAPAESQEAVQERFRTCARYYNYYIPKFAFHQYAFGEWGNVRDFDWPPADHETLDWARSFNISDTIVQGGIAQASYDEELDR
jgi:peptide/nickel transport system substrate-binding protein